MEALRQAAVGVAVFLTCGGACLGQPYPSRPLQLIVPFSAGSSTDTAARGFAAAMSASLGQSIAVVNREGASGTIAMAAVASAAPDGHTLVLSPQGPLTIQPHLNAKLSYRAETFQPICQIFEDTFAIVVGPKSPIDNFNDLLTRARARPKALTFASSGVATVPHLLMENVAKSAGVEFVHAPYRSYGQMVPDILGGTVDFAIAPIATMRGSDVRALSIVGAARSPFFDGTPTMKELGYPFAMPGVGGLFVHRSVPGAIQNDLRGACSKAFVSETFQKMIANAGMSPSFLSDVEFASRLEQESRNAASLIKLLKIGVE